MALQRAIFAADGGDVVTIAVGFRFSFNVNPIGDFDVLRPDERRFGSFRMLSGDSHFGSFGALDF